MKTKASPYEGIVPSASLAAVNDGVDLAEISLVQATQLVHEFGEESR